MLLVYNMTNCVNLWYRRSCSSMPDRDGTPIQIGVEGRSYSLFAGCRRKGQIPRGTGEKHWRIDYGNTCSLSRVDSYMDVEVVGWSWSYHWCQSLMSKVIDVKGQAKPRYGSSKAQVHPNMRDWALICKPQDERSQWVQVGLDQV